MAELGALSLRIQEQGGDQVLQKLRQVDAAAKLTGVSTDQAAKALNRLGIAAKVSSGQIVVAEQEVQRASGIVRQLGSNAVVTAGQVDVVTQSVGRLGVRADTTATQVTKLSPKLRSGASAVAALSIAAVTGGGSLAGMATQAGLVGSVMAAEFAPAKWAGYAAGIGAAVIAVTALVGIMQRLRAEQAKPSPFSLQRIEDIKQLTLAQDEYTRHRQETARLEADIAASDPRKFRAPVEQIAELNRLEKLNAALKKSRELETAALKKQQELRNQTIIEGAELDKQAIITAAEKTRTVRLSELAKEQAAVDAAFQAGTADLKAQYDKRREVILKSADLERNALAAKRAQLLKPIAGETPEAARGRQIEAGQISAEINALANETAARLTALDAQRAADERALAAKVLGYQQQLEQFSDAAFEKRMQQINAEDTERRRTLAQRGNATAQELADLDALTAKQKAQLFLQKAQADLARLREDLAARLQEVENKRIAGLITEEQASRDIAAIEQSSLPTLREMVQRALEFAAALGDEGAVAALKKLKIELGGLGFDVAAISKLQSQAESLGEILRSAIEGGFARGLGQGGIGQAFKGLLAEVSTGLGSMAIKIGLDAIKVSSIMKPLVTALTSLNPWVALAAGAALVALGSSLGGSRSGTGSGVSFSGGSTTAATPLSVSRLIVDPNAGVRQRISSAGMQSAQGSPANPFAGVTLLNVESPKGTELLATRVRSYTGRGG